MNSERDFIIPINEIKGGGKKTRVHLVKRPSDLVEKKEILSKKCYFVK
jgi:hypothetical protein